MMEKYEQEEPAIRALFRKVTVSLQDRFQTLIERPWSDVQQEIELHARSLQEENAHQAIDKPSEQLLAYTAVILAAYRIILTMIKDKDQVLEILQGVMGDLLKETIEGYLVSRFGITQDAPEKAFEMACINFKKRGEEQMGSMYVYEQEVSEETRCVVNVRKCFFNDFFRDNGAPEVTPVVFCVQDNIWMDELNKPKYGLTVTRSSILAEGSDACGFHFTKADTD